MANEQANTNIAVPKFFKDYNGGLETFEKNLKNLEDIAGDPENPQQAAAKERLTDIKKSIIFINKPNAEGVVEGEAIYARGVYYGAGSKINIDSDGTINVQTTDDQTKLSTHSGIITVGNKVEGDDIAEAFNVTNAVGNITVGTTIDENMSLYKILYDMLNKTSVPTVNALPGIKIVSDFKGLYEVGEQIDSTLSYSTGDGSFKGNFVDGAWDANKITPAGCTWSNISYEGPGVSKDSGKFSYKFATDTSITVKVTAHHSAATCELKDSVGGVFNSAALIGEGNKGSAVSTSAKYKVYWGTTKYNNTDFPKTDQILESVDELQKSDWLELKVDPDPKDEATEGQLCYIINILKSTPYTGCSIAVSIPEGWEIYDIKNGIGGREDVNFKQGASIINKNGIKYNVFYRLFSKDGNSVVYKDVKIRKIKKI